MAKTIQRGTFIVINKYTRDKEKYHIHNFILKELEKQ